MRSSFRASFFTDDDVATNGHFNVGLVVVSRIVDGKAPASRLHIINFAANFSPDTIHDMPRRSRTGKKKFRTRKVARVYRRRNIPTVLPSVYTCRLNYAEEVSLSVGADSIVAATYRANDLFDPRYAVGGHQPAGFDTLCQIYTRFTVIASKIRVTYCPPSNTAQIPAIWGIRLVDTAGETAAISTIQSLLEQENNTRHQAFSIGVNSAISKYGNHRTSKFSLKKFFDKKTAKDDADYECTSAASPTEQAYFEIYAAGNNGIDPDLCSFIVQIEYVAICRGDKALPES